MRIRQINFKVSDEERKELNSLILQKGCSISNIIREGLKAYYKLDGFEPSYTQTASKSYKSKWGLY